MSEYIFLFDLDSTITRKEILKAVNHMAHELEKHHLVLPKSEEEMKVI